MTWLGPTSIAASQSLRALRETILFKPF
jgi:hypothetical protein